MIDTTTCNGRDFIKFNELCSSVKERKSDAVSRRGLKIRGDVTEKPRLGQSLERGSATITDTYKMRARVWKCGKNTTRRHCDSDCGIQLGNS